MLERLAWLLLAAIHALPALALLRPAMITRLYGVVPGGSGFLLLHHRAALFLVVVVICCWAIADPAVRRLAAVATAISMVGFLVLYAQGGRPPALRTIAIADLIGLLPLGLVAWLAYRPVPA